MPSKTDFFRALEYGASYKSNVYKVLSGSDDVAVEMGEIRDNFFDETSYWCLPRKVTKLNHDTQASNMRKLTFNMFNNNLSMYRCIFEAPISKSRILHVEIP